MQYAVIVMRMILHRCVFLCVCLALAGEIQAQRNARDLPSDSGTLPTWNVDPEFLYEDFCFVRLRYSVDGTYGMGHEPEFRWRIDAPDSDINFSWRLQQMTSIRVHPDGDFVSITDPRLTSYPFLYIVEPGRMHLTDEEVPILRKHLLNGAFLMFDDFWGEREWRVLQMELKRLFPGREPQELSLDHPIFHCVFDLKEKPQVPGVSWGIRSQYNGGITWERPDAREPHYRAIYDDKGRMMVLVCQNTDNGDGWEQEGASEFYFREFSEKKAYPLGINIIFYTMTH